MSNLEKARLWAAYVNSSDSDITQATASIIQELPDQWVDAVEVREILEGKEGRPPATALPELVRDLRNLIAPKLPTLADMTREEWKACQWMQARYSGSDYDHVIVRVWQGGAALLRKDDGLTFDAGHASITPLPDLPKLQWPGGVVDAEIVDEPETADPGSIHTPMQPSEVPPNEPWLIEVDGQKAIGTRYRGDAVAPWSVAALDGPFAGDYNDREVTLIHKLVPETHALPEGMRLADHEKYGRVVTSPWGDGDDDYKIFFLNEDARGGADYDFAHESRLTFLDGDQHV